MYYLKEILIWTRRPLFWRCSLNQGWFHFHHFTLHSLKLCFQEGDLTWCLRREWCWVVLSAESVHWWDDDQLCAWCVHSVGGDFAFDSFSVILTERAKHGHCSTVLDLTSKENCCIVRRPLEWTATFNQPCTPLKARRYTLDCLTYIASYKLQ